MKDWKSLAHVKWDCKYHVVIVPKYRRKVLFGKIRKRTGEILRQLCRQKGVELVEGHVKPDHVHMVLSIPPKFSVAMTLGYLKGKSAIQLHREIMRIQQGYTGKHFWTKGYCVSTVGLDEDMIRAYVRHQDKLDQQLELNFND